MRRQKRFKKTGFPSLSREGKEKAQRTGISILIAIFFLATLVLLVRAFLYRSDYFRLKAVEARDVPTGRIISSPPAGEILKLYKDRNIFAINIKGIAKSLQGSYPDAKDIIVRRLLPDKLVIDLNFRRPVAVIGNGRGYPIDNECCIVPNVDPALLKSLPVISGISPRNVDKKGKRVESKNLRLALALLKETKESLFAAEYGVKSIDASDPTNLVFYTAGGLEIRIGCESFKERLNKLKKMLKDPRLVMDKIEYMDLRFEDAAIGPK